MNSLVIALNSPIFTEGLERILSKSAYSFLIHSYKINAEDSLSCFLKEKKPTILVLDIKMSSKVNKSCCKMLKRAFPKMKIIFLGEEDPKCIKQCFRLGADSYLLYNVTSEEFQAAIHAVIYDRKYLQRQLSQFLAEFSLGITDGAFARAPKITPRERQVLKLIVEEYTTKEIAKELFISFCTVETHRLNLINKLGVKNTAGLVREAIHHELYVG